MLTRSRRHDTRYEVRSTDHHGAGEQARILNEMAEKGWRLVSATTYRTGVHKPRVYSYFEREKPEK